MQEKRDVSKGPGTKRWKGKKRKKCEMYPKGVAKGAPLLR